MVGRGGGVGGVQGSGGGAVGFEEVVEGDGGDIIKGDIKVDDKYFEEYNGGCGTNIANLEKKSKIVQVREGRSQ